MTVRTTALIAVRSDGYVDGASFSGVGDTDFREYAKRCGFEVREVDRTYAKQVVFTHIAVGGNTLLA